MSRTGHLLELDVLRSQVVDLSHQLAERDRLAQHQREQSDQLRAIVEGTAAETGKEFFSALVTHLTSALHIKYAFIGEVQGDHIKKIRTLAVSAGGAIVDNFEYALAHTPCASALTQSFACFDKDLQTMFPQFTRLADLGAESYCAVPLRTKDGATIGLLVVMDTKPWEQGDDLRSLLEVFAPRVAAEFEWRRAEQERAQALADLHNVVETIPDIVFALDTQGNMVKWNRRLGDVTGYSPAELWSKPALAFVPPEEQTHTAAAIQKVFMEGYAELEGHLLTKAHCLIPYHWTAALLKNRHGEPVGITGIGRDVSEKKRAEGALRASEERYRSLYDDTPTMYFTLSTDGTVLSVNRFGAEQLGYRVEELVGNSVLGIFHKDDKETVAANLSECLVRPEATRHWECRKVRKDGRIIWVHETARVSPSPTGENVVLATCEDITEHRQMEESLRKSEHYNRILFENSPVGLVICRLDGAIEDCNERYVNILGRDRRDILGKICWELTSKKNDEHARAVKETVCRTGRFGPYEMDYVHADGQLVPVQLFGSLIEKDDELFMACSVEDITERKQAEHESQERARQALELLIALLALSHLDGTERTLSELTPHVTKIVADTLEVARVSVWLLSEDRTELVCKNLYDRSCAVHSAGSSLTVLNFPRYFQAIENSLVVAVSDALADPRTNELAHSYLLPLGIASMMDVPIHRQGKFVGVVCFEHVGPPRKWSYEIQSFGASVGESVVRMMETAERKQAEEALRLTQLSVDRAADMAFWLDSSARFLYVNDAACQRLGYSRDELLSMTVADVDLDCRMGRWPQLWNDLRKQTRLRFETRHRTKSKEFFPVEVVANYVAFMGQEYNFAFSRDITDRKRAEEVLRQRERDLRAALDERERISQDLHDGILQSVFAVGLALETTKSMMSPRNRKAFGPALDRAIKQLNLVMREIRNFIAGLGSDLLQGKDLSTALQQMLASLTQNQATRVRLAVESRAAEAVSIEQSLHLFHVIQEAVSNCIRHGRAQEARVSLKMLKQGVRLSIRDNGSGFNPEASKQSGHGLSNMAARAKKIGGRFTVLSKVDEGTRVVLDLPKETTDASR